MEPTARSRISQAWATLAGIDKLERLRVVVIDRDSMLGPPGWVCTVCIDDQLTVGVPRAEAAADVLVRLRDLTVSSGAIEPDEIIARFPPAQRLGPAYLLYALHPLAAREPLERVPADRLASLRATMDDDEWSECGLEHTHGDVFVRKDEHGHVVAACGYERWPADIAQVCVATAPRVRRRGAALEVAKAAIGHAQSAGLLPQWRARPAASRALARKLGLTPVGFQLNLRLP